jgi:CRISPR/Cas system-associated protein Cas10 (large subunit of type III CRISPR-Cas system)
MAKIMSIEGLELVRLSALLHDIGKPECWANSRPWSEHARLGRKLLSPLFGEEVAETASRHHSSSYYDQDDRPSTVEEKIVCVADSIASSSDRPDEPQAGSPLPSPPISLAHPLSESRSGLKGEVEKASSAAELLTFTERFRNRFRNGGSFDEVIGFLRDNASSIPADTRPPNNDSSLYDHLKLTAAVANCIYRQGFKGFDRKKYTFALISGDADKIGHFLGRSYRLPDLRARSQVVKKATDRAVEEMVRKMGGGKECVIYNGGGGFLVLSVPELSQELSEVAKSAFLEETSGRGSITVSSVNMNGIEMERFGDVWSQAVRSMRDAKLSGDMLWPGAILQEGQQVCDACREEAATIPSQRLLHVDANPRPEMLCEYCAKIRELGRSGRSIEEIADSSGSVAMIKFDGDKIGQVLDGRLLQRFEKSQTPARIATLSRLINATCEVDIERIVEDAGGLTVISGGDDVLAITSGLEGLKTALKMAEYFKDRFKGSVTASAGVAIFDEALPIYTALEAVYDLLRRAKSDGGDRVAFSFISGIWERPGGGSYRWEELKELLSFSTIELPTSQLRPLVDAAMKGSFKAEVLLKYQMGRGEIPWEEGVKLLDYNTKGMLKDAFMIYNYLKDAKPLSGEQYGDD